jgi:hypothetical protein
MSERLDLLIVASTAPDTLAKALARVEVPVASLNALVVSVPEANATVVQLLDDHGRPSEVDPALFARILSVGGHGLAVARVDPSANSRRWERYLDGAQVETLGVDDELYVPHDEDGFPDLDVPPVRASDGVPEGWRRLRSALDLGMKRFLSCRFTPVLHRWERLHHAADNSVRAYALVVGGRALRPPQEIAWQELFRR